MVTKEQIENRIRAGFPDGQIEVRDTVGDGDHWHATVVSPAFEGKRPVARQQMVYAALGELMRGPIHAIQLETLTPTQLAERQAQSGLVQPS